MSKLTFVIEFEEGKEPPVHAHMKAFGGAVVAVAFRNALKDETHDADRPEPLTITLPDHSSKAFWSGTGKNEVFHPETYKHWVKETIERACIIAGIGVEVR